VGRFVVLHPTVLRGGRPFPRHFSVYVLDFPKRIRTALVVLFPRLPTHCHFSLTPLSSHLVLFFYGIFSRTCFHFPPFATFAVCQPFFLSPTTFRGRFAMTRLLLPPFRILACPFYLCLSRVLKSCSVRFHGSFPLWPFPPSHELPPFGRLSPFSPGGPRPQIR